MRNLIFDIQNNHKNDNWTNIILNAIDKNYLSSSGFSEFETYGTYMFNKHKDLFIFKNTKSIRNTYSFFGGPEKYLTFVGLFLNRYSWSSFENWDKNRKNNFVITSSFYIIRLFNEVLSKFVYQISAKFNLDFAFLKISLYLTEK